MMTTREKLILIIIAILGFLLIFGALLSVIRRTSLSKCDLPILKGFSTKCLPVPMPAMKTPIDQTDMSRVDLENYNIETVFDKEKFITFFPVLKDGKVYYLKNGDIWLADLAEGKTISPKILLDIKEEDILSFDISNNQKLLAYSLKRNVSNYDEFTGSAGDTIIVRNLEDLSEFEIYSDKGGQDMQIHGILFSPDDKQLLFSNNSIWLVDLNIIQLKKYATKDKNSSCPIYFLDGISANGFRVLARNGCYSGSIQEVVNIQTGEIESKFYNSMEVGSWVFGFISNNLLLAYDYEPGKERGSVDFINHIRIYDAPGKLIRTILESSWAPLYFDNRSTVGKVYFHLVSNGTTSNQGLRYEIDTQTLELNRFLEKKNIVAVLYNNDDRNDISIWATNDMFENPIFIDRGIKSITNKRIFYLRLK